MKIYLKNSSHVPEHFHERQSSHKIAQDPTEPREGPKTKKIYITEYLNEQLTTGG